MVLPTVAVEGTSVAVPIPPVGVVYHNKVLPGNAVAVKAEAVTPWQYITGVADTIGAGGGAVTTTVVCFTHAVVPVPTVTVYT
jgi:hypothetical protein